MSKKKNREMPKTAAKTARESILDAAEAIVAEKGASFMTMDAVAAKAGVSKGGLIYHFPSQEALLQTLIQRFSDRVTEHREEIRQRVPENAAQEAVAYIVGHTSFCGEEPCVGTGLVAAAMRAPQLLDTVRAKRKASIRSILERAKNPERIAILLLAADCTWLLDTIGLQSLTKEELEKVKDEIVKLAYEWSGVKPPSVTKLRQFTA